MNCDCSCEFDGEAPELFSMRVRSARKNYVCEECGSAINRGDKYEYSSGLWEGRWESFKTCLTCMKIRDDLCPHGHTFGQLGDAIENCMGFDYLSVPT